MPAAVNHLKKQKNQEPASEPVLEPTGEPTGNGSGLPTAADLCRSGREKRRPWWREAAAPNRPRPPDPATARRHRPDPPRDAVTGRIRSPRAATGQIRLRTGSSLPSHDPWRRKSPPPDLERGRGRSEGDGERKRDMERKREMNSPTSDRRPPCHWSARSKTLALRR